MRLTPPALSYGIDPWTQETTQMLPLGSIGFDPFGNKYRYVQNSTTLLVTGNLIQAQAIPANFVDLAVAVAAPLRVTGAAPQPNYSVTLTLGGTAVTAGQFVGGRAVVSVTPGLGNQYTIASHQVQTSTTGNCVFTFEETIITALTTSSKMTVVPHPYGNVVQSPTTPTNFSAGICIYPLTAQTTSPVANYYGWVGCAGTFGALSDATAASVGNGISPSTSTAGCITKAVTLKDSIGYHITTPTSGEVEPQWFNIN